MKIFSEGLRYGLKVTISFLLLWILLRRLDLAEIIGSFHKISFYYVFLSFIIICVVWFINSWRWQIILSAYGVFRKLSALFALNIISNFYGFVLPGGKISSEAVRVYRVVKMEHDEGKNNGIGVDSRVVFVSLLDRIFSLMGILFFVVSYMVIRYDYMPPFFTDYRVVLLSAFVIALIVIFFAVFSDKGLRLLNGLISRFSNIDSTGILSFEVNKYKIFISLILSLLNVFVVSFAFYALFIGFGFSGINFFDITFAISLSTLLIIIPVTVGGIGLREGGIMYILSLFGISLNNGALLSLTNLFVLFMFAALGGIYELYFQFIKK